MRILRVSLLMSLFALGACERQAPDAPAAAVAAPTVAAAAPLEEQPRTTKAQWVAAMKGTYIETNRTSDEGVTEFVACFQEGAKSCDLPAFAIVDAFRKLATFEPANSRLARHGMPKYLRSYVSVLDCERPSIMFNPSFFSKNGWMFMTRVSVLADGELVVDQPLEHGAVRREVDAVGVAESGTWVATDKDIEGLRQAARSSQLIVRISGEKGYVTMSKEDVTRFRKDAADVTGIYDRLDAALKNKIPHACT